MTLKIHRPPEDEPLPPLRGQQFSLLSLFVISTLIAFGLAGYNQVGLPGVVGMLFGGWLMAVGVYLLLYAYRQSRQRHMAFVAGVSTLLIGFVAAVSIITAEKADSGIDAVSPIRILESNSVMLIAVGFVCYVLWDIKRVKWDMSFVVSVDGITRPKGIAGNKLAHVEEFFKNTKLSTRTKLTVQAKRDQHGNLIVSCLGDVSRAERQRIRNFLVDTL